MNKNEVISIILKSILILIIILGLYNFIYWNLWEEKTTDLFVLLQILLPIIVFGISAVLLGIIALLDTKK